jgi:hypothetical protein
MTDQQVTALFLLVFMVVGLCSIMYPRATLGWFIRDRQWTADEPSMHGCEDHWARLCDLRVGSGPAFLNVRG